MVDLERWYLSPIHELYQNMKYNPYNPLDGTSHNKYLTLSFN